MFWMEGKMRSLFLCVCAVLMAGSLGLAGPITLTNPGFETGDFTGWTRSGNLGATSVNSSGPHSGTYQAALGPVGSLGYIAQDIATTAGSAYDVTFYLYGSGTPNQLDLYWDGGLAASWVNVSIPSWTIFGWSNLVASSGSTELKFGFRNDPSYLHLDDIAVDETGAVPEPSTLWLCGAGALLLLARRRK